MNNISFLKINYLFFSFWVKCFESARRRFVNAIERWEIMATRGRSITRLNIDRRHSAYACIRAVANTIQFLFSTGRSSSRCTVLSIESRAIMFEKANCLSQIIDFYSIRYVDQCFRSSIHYLGIRANEIRLLSIIKRTFKYWNPIDT